jgi:hypothetical protein
MEAIMFYIIDKDAKVTHPAFTATSAAMYLASLPPDQYILIKSDEKGDRIIKVETIGFSSVKQELEAA